MHGNEDEVLKIPPGIVFKYGILLKKHKKANSRILGVHGDDSFSDL